LGKIPVPDSRLPLQGQSNGLLQLRFRKSGADEQFLAGASAKRNSFPSVGDWHGDSNPYLTFRVAYRPDHTWYHGSDLGIILEQALQNVPDTIDYAVLDFELTLQFAQSHVT
jgi:hypothetical protein